MSIHDELITKFPVRRNENEKKDFRAWVIQKAQDAGWQTKIEETSRNRQKNIIIGNPEHAAVIFTAHYDTSSNMILPDLRLPRNIPVYVCWHLMLVLIGLIISFIVMRTVQVFIHDVQILSFIFVFTYLGLLLFIAQGPANRNNANGSSGLAAAMQLMLAIPEEDRSKCAFILFDGGEKGRLGSRGYAREHLELQYMRLFVHFDAVGSGDHMLLISSSMARRCTGYHTLEKILSQTEGCTGHFFDSKLCTGNGDQKSFKCGTGLIACEYKPGLGFVTGRLRTSRDTVCNQRNLDWIEHAFTDFVHRMGKE